MLDVVVPEKSTTREEVRASVEKVYSKNGVTYLKCTVHGDLNGKKETYAWCSSESPEKLLDHDVTLVLKPEVGWHGAREVMVYRDLECPQGSTLCPVHEC